MATSSSDESCSAPIDFNICSSLEELNSRGSLTLEKCPLCMRSRRIFYCQDCIHYGDFIHSNSRYPERYADKKLKLYKLKKERLKDLESIEEECQPKMEVSKLKSEVEATRNRILQLKNAIKESRSLTENCNKDITEIQMEMRYRQAKVPKFTDKIRKVEKYILQFKQGLAQQKQQLAKCQDELKDVVRTNISQLVQYIFPISEVHPAKSEEDSNVEDTVTALAEATRTAYIKGRWIYTDNSSDVQYKIVEACLPGNGDYSMYSMCVAANRDSVPGTDPGHKNEAYTIGAALTLTTQLVNVLAFYLDINLPHKLCYSSFCSHELSEQKFAQKVAKLNTNVLHLCFSQNVNPELINPRHTIRNLLLLINHKTSDLGRCGAFEVNPELMLSMEGSLASDLYVSDSSENSQSDEETDLIADWEKIHNLPLEEMQIVPTRVSMSATTTVQSHSQARHTSHPQTTTSITGGLVTSAAASVVSWWRAATGK